MSCKPSIVLGATRAQNNAIVKSLKPNSHADGSKVEYGKYKVKINYFEAVSLI